MHVLDYFGIRCQAHLIDAIGEPTTDPACRMCGETGLRPAGMVDGYSFVECSDCGMVFTSAVTRTTSEALYRSGYHGPSEGAPVSGWANAEFLEPAFDLLPEGPLAILDFGTGQSFVPDMLRAAGHRVIAVDIVAPLRRHPDRLTGSLRACGLADGSFDLVFAFQVFEHLPEPRSVLDGLLRLARPGGLVLIHTDMETPERAAGLARWWYVSPPDHCAFYRHRTFERVLAGTSHTIAWREPKAIIIRT